MSIKENYAVNHRLVTDLPLVISGWLKVDRRSGTRINVVIFMNDLDDGVINKLLKFADDTEIGHYRKTLPPNVFKFGLLPNAHIMSENHCH